MLHSSYSSSSSYYYPVILILGKAMSNKKDKKWKKGADSENCK